MPIGMKYIVAQRFNVGSIAVIKKGNPVGMVQKTYPGKTNNPYSGS